MVLQWIRGSLGTFTYCSSHPESASGPASAAEMPWSNRNLEFRGFQQLGRDNFSPIQTNIQGNKYNQTVIPRVIIIVS